MAKLIVTSSSPLPRNRGGETFSGAKAFELDHFTFEQLSEIIKDPVLTVVLGDVVTDAEIVVKKPAAKKPAA
jgi:hypothetical protein